MISGQTRDLELVLHFCLFIYCLAYFIHRLHKVIVYLINYFAENVFKHTEVKLYESYFYFGKSYNTQ